MSKRRALRVLLISLHVFQGLSLIFFIAAGAYRIWAPHDTTYYVSYGEWLPHRLMLTALGVLFLAAVSLCPTGVIYDWLAKHPNKTP